MTKGRKTRTPRQTKFSIYLTEKDHARLLRILEEEGTDKSTFARRAVLLMIGEIENFLELPRIKLPTPRTKAKPKPKPEKAEHEDEAEEKKPITRFVIG